MENRFCTIPIVIQVDIFIIIIIKGIVDEFNLGKWSPIVPIPQATLQQEVVQVARQQQEVVQVARQQQEVVQVARQQQEVVQVAPILEVLFTYFSPCSVLC
jgi:hypothetical protein